jgi:hypothetical protein
LAVMRKVLSISLANKIFTLEFSRWSCHTTGMPGLTIPTLTPSSKPLSAKYDFWLHKK